MELQPHAPTLLPSTFNTRFAIELRLISIVNRTINRNPLWNRAQVSPRKRTTDLQHFAIQKVFRLHCMITYLPKRTVYHHWIWLDWFGCYGNFLKHGQFQIWLHLFALLLHYIPPCGRPWIWLLHGSMAHSGLPPNNIWTATGGKFLDS